MKKQAFFFILTVLSLFSCSTKQQDNDVKNESKSTDSIPQNLTTISGKILNRDVYPHVKDVTLTIPGFKGDAKEFKSTINEDGTFSFAFYPKTNREIKLYPIEDILVVQPGDSLYIVKDFKDIGHTQFYADRAELNQHISLFHAQYLGRYPTDLKQPYLDYKNACDKEKNRVYKKLIKFQEQNLCSDDFNSWAIKRIELDYCKALFDYPFQHYIRSEIPLSDSTAYFSFIKELEHKVDPSIVMSDYFTTSNQYVMYKLSQVRKEHPKSIENKDSIIKTLMNDLFDSTDNNYLAQFTLSSYLSNSLKWHHTELVEKNQEMIYDKLTDPFLFENLQEHFDWVKDYNHNPRHVSDVLLGSDQYHEKSIGTSIGSGSNTVKEVIQNNPEKVIYVEFWATWCSPCIHSMEYSKKLMSDFKDKDVAFVFICVNSNEQLWREKVHELNIDGQHIYCDIETTRAIRQRFGFSGIPYYLLINKEGVIVDFGNHLRPYTDYTKNKIEKLLKE